MSDKCTILRNFIFLRPFGCILAQSKVFNVLHRLVLMRIRRIRPVR